MRQVQMRLLFLTRKVHSLKNMDSESTTNGVLQIVKEGLATIKTSGKVFYNPVQEFNRDLSIAAITAFVKYYKSSLGHRKNTHTIPVNEESCYEAGNYYTDGVTVLEALAATGLRSIRYAKEIPGINNIIANDISEKAVHDMVANIKDNNVEHLVTSSHDDATMLMYRHRQKNQFDIIDLDPYGCPSTFLDSAVQSVKDGGLLLVTATDMAILAGNSPETCYVKYGAVSLKIKCCHEMGLRILLQCIEAHANRYGRYIEPLLSLSADFYIRVFVRIFTGPNKCKQTTSKLSMVYHCRGCDSFKLQPLGLLKQLENKQLKYGLPTVPPVTQSCEHCGHTHHMGGPIWSAPIHSLSFVQHILNSASENLSTYKRIEGVLNVILEELLDCPLYYTLDSLCKVLHVVTPPLLIFRSALLNAGYKVSLTHMHKASIKTNAPTKVIWDIMRCWQLKNPVNPKRLLENSPATNILKVKSEKEYSFELHPEANPESRKAGFVRFQENPLPHWGPGTRSTAMIGEQRIDKSKRNQGKRKRETSEENSVQAVDFNKK